MALLTTILEIIGVLAAIAAFLWFSTVIEARQLGPVSAVTVEEPVDAADRVPAV